MIARFMNLALFFSAYLGIHPETGLRYLLLGVLTAGAVTASDNRPLFNVDPVSIERHRASIRVYRTRMRAAAHNVKDLTLV